MRFSSASVALAQYRRRKLELADLIREVMSVAAERRDEEGADSARELLGRLGEDRFQLAVVGQFSRGKSTLMNAILGRPYLPTGALPMTSVVTTVRYGSRPRVFVRRAGGRLPIESSLGELVRFVAQSSREREELRVVAVDVEVPAEILRLGFSFVDTPGIGSAIAANTAITERFLPDADAVIFVTSFDAPLSEAELEFLATVRRHVEKLFVVINKLDLVSESEAQSVICFVREQLGDHAGDGGLRVFATSARGALASRLASDREGLAASGLPALERPLERFLTVEKSRVLLAQTAARAQRQLERVKIEIELSRIAQAHDRDGREARDMQFAESVADLTAEVRRLAEDLLEHVNAQLGPALSQRSQRWHRKRTNHAAWLTAGSRSASTAWSTLRFSLKIMRCDMQARGANLRQGR